MRLSNEGFLVTNAEPTRRPAQPARQPRHGEQVLVPAGWAREAWGSCRALWVTAQHEGALPPPCIVRKDPRVGN